MNGAHDMGGMQGFGKVTPEPEGDRFHAEWERRVLAITLAMGATGKWNIDMSRSARESVPPQQYLASSYYQIWFEGLKRLLVDTGLATAAETADGTLRVPPLDSVTAMTASQVPARLARGTSAQRTLATQPRFAVGDAVKTRLLNPAGHTRLPRYCRGKRGTILALHGAHVFADTHATGAGEQPQWLYTVRFDAKALWGADTTASSVCVDCFEPYLEAAE
jgi:nitrile hydratase beta subunit